MPAQPGCQRLGCSTVQHIEAHLRWSPPLEGTSAERRAAGLDRWQPGCACTGHSIVFASSPATTARQRMHPRCLLMHQPRSRRPPAHLSACGSSAAIRSSASPGTRRMAAPAGGAGIHAGGCGSRSCRDPRESARCASGVGAGRALQCPRRGAAPPPAASSGGRDASPSAQPRRQLWPCQISLAALTGLQGAGWPCRTPLQHKLRSSACTHTRVCAPPTLNAD